MTDPIWWVVLGPLFLAGGLGSLASFAAWCREQNLAGERAVGETLERRRQRAA